MKIGIIGNITKESLFSAIEHLLQLEERLPLDCYLHATLEKEYKKRSSHRVLKKRFLSSQEIIAECDIVVAFGGDGTILRAAQEIADSGIPIVGVNLGKLGFLAEISLDELEDFLRDILNDRHLIEKRSLVEIQIEQELQHIYALNEVVIDKSNTTRLIHLSVYVNEDYLVSFPGDGIIIATPTGSTGYALAAGGPIVVPTTDVFIIQPVSPHSLSARTVIVPDSSIIRVVVEHLSEEARISTDGQLGRIFSPPAKIIVQKAKHSVRLAKRKDRNYYDILRTKLLWGSDIRLIKGKVE